PILSLLKLWREGLGNIAGEHRRARFDAVVGVWATESGWLATRAARRLGVPCLVHLAGGELVSLPTIGYGNRTQAIAAWQVRSTLNAANLITFPSEPVRHLLAKHFPGTLQSACKLALGVDIEMLS